MSAHPTAPSPRVDVETIARTTASALTHAVWTLTTTSPLFGTAFVVAVLVASAGAARRAYYGGWERDDVRLFPRADRAVILERAGHRCEHHVPGAGRCRATTGLQADHVHPWSRGGHTVLANGQALCRRHNREKNASVPFERGLHALERRRAGYFPAGEPTTVSRRRPPAPGRGRRPAGGPSRPPVADGAPGGGECAS